MLQRYTSAFGLRRPTSMAGQFAALLDGFYRDLLEQGIPENLAALVRQLDDATGPREGRRLAIVVDSDPDDRSRAAVLLEETGLEVIECASAGAAIGVLQHRAAETAFVFADRDLAGDKDGLDLARSIATLWPGIRIVLTLEGAGPATDLPAGVVALQKPWRGLDVLMEAERALGPG